MKPELLEQKTQVSRPTLQLPAALENPSVLPPNNKPQCLGDLQTALCGCWGQHQRSAVRLPPGHSQPCRRSALVTSWPQRGEQTKGNSARADSCRAPLPALCSVRKEAKQDRCRTSLKCSLTNQRKKVAGVMCSQLCTRRTALQRDRECGQSSV